ncbi:MAG: PmoA family protein [Planctomycetaceae bacterium]
MLCSQFRPSVPRFLFGKQSLALLTLLAIGGADVCGQADDHEYRPPKCEILPLPNDQVSFRIDGVEKLRWHFGSQYPRPFFYPLNGPSGEPLTRMGHPGAQNHDHHRSIWFAHHAVNGTSFWADASRASIRQKYWYRYRDGDSEAVMASCLGWFDEEGKELLEQDLVAALIPLANDQHALEIQLTLRPPSGGPPVTLQKTNFGVLAVRVAGSISGYFGGGQLSDSEGRVGEPAIFGQQAKWMDYSGPLAVGTGPQRTVVTEGITYFDHPDNPRYPTFWHVREDGWMGASYGMHADQIVTEAEPLTLRYLLWAHSGPYNATASESVHADFRARPGFRIRKPTASEKHRQYEVERIPDDAAGDEN